LAPPNAAGRGSVRDLSSRRRFSYARGDEDPPVVVHADRAESER
jgi:hypothetical protein